MGWTLCLLQKMQRQCVWKEVKNNDIKIREPPVSFRSGFWKHFSIRVNVHNGKEVVEKEIKTVCKLCHNDASYKSGNICNISSHLKQKQGIIFSSTASPSASNNSKSDTSVSTLLLPRQRLLLANYVKKNCKKLLHVNPNSVTSPLRLGQSLAFELINTIFQYCTRNIHVQGLQFYIAARRRHVQLHVLQVYSFLKCICVSYRKVSYRSQNFRYVSYREACVSLHP